MPIARQRGLSELRMVVTWCDHQQLKKMMIFYNEMIKAKNISGDLI